MIIESGKTDITLCEESIVNLSVVRMILKELARIKLLCH